MNISFKRQEISPRFIKALPHWCSFNKSTGRIEINPDKMYGVCLGALGERANQYWLEVARRCVTTYVLEKFKSFKEPLYVRFVKTKNNKYKLNKYEDLSPNKDDAARGAGEFRAYYPLIKLALDTY